MIDGENTSDGAAGSGDEADVVVVENTADTSDYIIADSNSRYLDESDIVDRSSEEIQMIINEIYA